jgi:hypothetical protein
MDPRAYLTELGYSAEEISAMLSDAKQAKLITAAANSYSEGKTLKQRSEAERQETATFWEQKTQELQGSVNRLTAAEKRAATAEAAAAQRTAYLKSLKDQGYDVPDEMLGSPATHTPEPPKYMTQEDFTRASRATAPDLVSLTALSNEYRALYGRDYVEIEEDFRAAQQAGKPLREFARSKYNFDAKKQELAAKADQDRINALVSEQMKVKESELAAKYGSNPDLRTPMPSKFDKLVKQEGFKGDSWKTPEGRKANREERLRKFENLSIQ